MADFGKLNFAVSFNPQTAFPLDARYFFDSLTEAQAAAQGAVEVGSSTGTYFFGQEIVVVESGVATLYVIQPDKSLAPVGSAPVGDNKSIVVTDGVIALDGFATAVAGQQPRIAADGTLEWYTPDTSTVSGLQEAVGQLQTDVDALEVTVAEKADADNVYTKQQTDDKISGALSSVYKPAGSVAFASLPTPGADNLGNVYNVTDEFTTDDRFVEGTGQEYPAGTNVAVVETSNEPATYKFDVMSGFVDLSGYLTTETASATYATKTELGNKVDKVTGSSLVQDTLITKLEGLANIKSVQSGQLAVDGSGNLSVTAISQDIVTGLSGALAGKVNVEAGKGLSSNDFTDDLMSKLEGIATGAQVNVLEAVKVNGTALPITGKAVNIPIATAQALGVVKGSIDENKVSVGADGTMEVNSVNVSKLVQTAGDTLILDGGTSTSASA